MSALEEFYAKHFFKMLSYWFIAMVIIVGAGIFYYKVNHEIRRCTDEELHLVIDKINQCRKEEVICSEQIRQKVLHDICGEW